MKLRCCTLFAGKLFIREQPFDAAMLSGRYVSGGDKLGLIITVRMWRRVELIGD